MKNTKGRLILVACLLLSILFPSAGKAQSMSRDNCVAYALEHNKELLASTKNSTIESAEHTTAQLALLPDVRLNAGANNYWKIPVQMFPAEILGGQPGTFMPIKLGLPYNANYGATAELPLVDVDKWTNIKLALLQKKLADADAKTYQQELVKNVKLSYCQVLLQQRSLAFSDSLYRSYMAIDALMQQKFKEGITDKISVNQSANILADRQNQLLQAAAQLKIALLNLKVWMGYPLDQDMVIQEETFTLPVLEDFEEESLPNLAWEKLRVDNVYNLLQKARNSWYPRLTLQASYTQTGYGNQFFTDFNWFPGGYAGLNFQFPLAPLFRMSTQIQETKAVWEQAKINYQQYVEKSQKDFYEQKALAEQYRNMLAQNEQSLQRAAETEQLTLQKLQNNIIDMMQIRQTTDDRYRLQEAYYNNLLHYQSAIIQLQYLQANK
jgi:outer membrane protein TolC